MTKKKGAEFMKEKNQKLIFALKDNPPEKYDESNSKLFRQETFRKRVKK